jgi:serralysin
MRFQVLVGFGFILSLVGCAADSPSDQDLSWDQFRATVYQEPDTGVFIVNGDEMLETEADLHSFYDRLMIEKASADLAEDGIGTTEQPLIVNLVSGKDDRWSSAQAQNLTYCVSQSSFGSQYSAVVNAMAAASSAWEGAARVNLVHDASQDGNCTKSSNVVFDVRQVCTGRYLARSFFPSSSRASREVLIDCTSFGNISPYTLNGVLRHELGHTLGFRHEHTRPESGTCFEDTSWRALTNYDSSSVMHYPQCNGTNKGDLSLTNSDKSGAGSLYP